MLSLACDAGVNGGAYAAFSSCPVLRHSLRSAFGFRDDARRPARANTSDQFVELFDGHFKVTRVPTLCAVFRRRRRTGG